MKDGGKMPEYSKKIKENAKSLRKNMTRQEKHLWYDFLSGHSLKFQRQRIINNYIADFYCHSIKLVIELDGSQHYKGFSPEYDLKRTDTFRKMAIDVLRISNLDVDRNFEGVCKLIDEKIAERIKMGTRKQSEGGSNSHPQLRFTTHNFGYPNQRFGTSLKSAKGRHLP